MGCHNDDGVTMKVKMKSAEIDLRDVFQSAMDTAGVPPDYRHQAMSEAVVKVLAVLAAEAKKHAIVITYEVR